MRGAVIAELRGMGLDASRTTRAPRRRGLRQPPGPHPARRGPARRRPALRAPGHGPAWRGRSSRSCEDGGWDQAPATRSSAPTTRPRSRCCSSSRAGRRRGRAGRPGAAVHHRRGGRAARAPGRSTPRACERASATSSTTRTPIGEIVVASPTYYRFGATSTARPPTPACAPRPAAARSPPRRGRSPRCRSGRIDEETTANVGAHRGRHGRRDEHRPRAAARSWPRRRTLDDAKRRGDGRRDGRPHPRRRQRPAAPVRRRRDGRAAVRGLPPPPAGPAVLAAEGALRACGYEPGASPTGGGSDANALRSPTGFPCTNLANGTERNHQPDERVSSRRWRACSTSRSPSSTSCAGRTDLTCRASSASAARPSTRAASSTSSVERFRYADGDEVEREIVQPPAAPSAIVSHDDEHLWLVRQPREAIGDPDVARAARRQADEEGEDAAGHRPARARRGDRQGGRALGAADVLLLGGRLHGRGGPRLPRHGPARRRAAEAEEDERIEVVRWPLDGPRRRASTPCKDAKTLIGLLCCAAPARRAERRRCSAGGRRRAAATNPRAWPSTTAPPLAPAALRAPRPRLPGLPGVRARAVAQHAGGLPLRPAAARRATSRAAASTRWRPRHERPGRRSSTELAAGARTAAPRRARDAAAQGRLPALLLPPPAPRGRHRARPDGRPARAAQEPEAAAGPHARRGRTAARAPRRAPTPAALRDRALLELMYACGLRA